jgi:hypothetical protein
LTVACPRAAGVETGGVAAPKETRASGSIRVLRVILIAVITACGSAGCGTDESGPAAPAAQSAPLAEGTIVNVEEGFLILRLADGRTEEFMVPSDDSVVPIDRLLSATGRRCRVAFKMAIYEDVDGSVRRMRELVALQFL